MHGASLTFEPATQDVFADVEEMLGPKKRPDAIACWCLTYRLGDAANALDAEARRSAVYEMCGRHPEPGLLAYDRDEVVGWAGVARRSDIAAFADESRFERVDDADPWTIFCLRARGGRRRRGIGTAVLAGAIDFARANGADVIEAWPVDTEEKIAPIYAYPGFRTMFEKQGFQRLGDAPPVPGGPPRVHMRWTRADQPSVTTVISSGDEISTR